MASIYLDTNILIDLYERNQNIHRELSKNTLFISPLSCHILCYTTKSKIPNLALEKLIFNMGVIPLSESVLERALSGPINDLEDNIQLHSAAEANCQYFMTNDKLLLKMKFFGTTTIVSKI